MTNEEIVDRIQKGINIGDNMGQLYIQNKGMIYAVVKKYRYACQADYNRTPIIELDELMHEAYFGLLKAVESYDASQGVLFMSYATYWIRQAVKRFLDDSGRVIRVPVHIQEKVYRYNQVTAYFLQCFNRDPSIREYASYLGESPKSVEHLQRFMLQNKVKSLDESIPGREEESITLSNTIVSDTDLESEVVKKVAQEQLQREVWDTAELVVKNSQMISVIRYRYIDRLTLDEIGVRLGVTREYVRQCESKALRLLRCNRVGKKLIDYLVA